MTHTLSKDRSTAVSTDTFYEPMETCPLSTKVILLGAGGVAVISSATRGDPFWKGWAPLPKTRKPGETK